jgi:YidC/Oxa1 family membrane protein insertase
MDSKNVIAAIALSSAVIVLYSLFFVPEQSITKQNLAEKNKIEQNTDTPSLDQKETLVQISREDALKESERIQFENQSILDQYL